jgi:hypothetical protein
MAIARTGPVGLGAVGSATACHGMEKKGASAPLLLLP